MYSNILVKIFRRQFHCVDSWEVSHFLDYSEEILMNRLAESSTELVQEEVFTTDGSIQDIAVSNDGEYMASGQTSNQHEIIVYKLKPKIRAIHWLYGHHRTPLYLTFDTVCSNVLYSGCLGGVVNSWDVNSGQLLKSFQCGVASPVCCIVPLLFETHMLLVAMRHALYLLQTEEMTMLWRAESRNGILRLVKHHPEAPKILTAIGHESPGNYRLQLFEIDSKKPPDLNNASHGLITEECAIVSSTSVVVTAEYVIYTDSKGLKNGPSYLLMTSMSGQKINFNRTIGRLVFMQLSPCKHYLMVGSGREIAIFDLRKKTLLKFSFWGHVNCGAWLPLSFPHPMAVCVGTAKGTMLLGNKQNHLSTIT